MEGTPLSKACEWLSESPSESIDAASRIFKVHRSTLRSSINQSAQQKQPRKGKNRVLSNAQTEALKKWILEQYYLGLGANRHMVYAAVCYLQTPLPPLSQSWLTNYIRNEPLEFHFITTKPIAQQRTQAQEEPAIIKWF
jgi:hypothetical protein